jgi:hypothetical protein
MCIPYRPTARHQSGSGCSPAPDESAESDDGVRPAGLIEVTDLVVAEVNRQRSDRVLERSPIPG